MSLKMLNEKAGYHSYLCRKAEARARRTAKRANARLMRRAARRDPENAPSRMPHHGWID